MDLVRKAPTTQRVRGLFKEILPNLVKFASAFAIAYTVYEDFKQAFGLS